MARYVYKLPDIGEGIAEAEIVKWHAEKGQQLAQDQPLVDVMTDKATVEITAPVAGVLAERQGGEGQKLPIGAVLAVFETEQAAAAAAAPDGQTAVASAPPKPHQHGEARAAPAVRQRATNLCIDLGGITGSGPGGLVLHDDLDRVLLARAPQPTRREEVEEIRLSGLRRRIAERMHESKSRIPHFTYVEEVDVGRIEEERARLNAAGDSPHLTLLPFFIRSLVRTIARHPEVNGHYDDGEGTIRRFRHVHVGIATQTERGLLVPVIRNAQDMDLANLSAAITRLSTAARAGKSAPADLTGSTITITSLGALGGLMATPIINPPELAVIGINRIRDTVVMREGRVEARRMMNLSSSFDHRIIDGFVAASFIAGLREDIESGSGGA